jgi:PKD repeat protein
MHRLGSFVALFVLTTGIVAPAVGAGTAPTVTTTAPSTVQAGERVAFQATLGNTTDAQFRWEFDDGSTASGWLVSNTYDDAGRYDVVVSAETSSGEISASITVTVLPAAEHTAASGATLQR